MVSFRVAFGLWAFISFRLHNANVLIFFIFHYILLGRIELTTASKSQYAANNDLMQSVRILLYGLRIIIRIFLIL